MAKKELAIHETLEIHEVMTMKQACLVKAHAVSFLIKDDELRKLVEQEVKDTEKALDELQKLLN